MVNDSGSLIGLIISALIVWWSYQTLKVSKQKGTSTVLYWVAIILCGCSALSNFVSLFQNPEEEPETKIIIVEKKDENKSS